MNSSGSRRSQRSNVGRSSRLSASHRFCSISLGGQVEIVGGQGVPQRFIDQTLAGEPGGGPAMQDVRLVRPQLGQKSLLQKLPPQMMIAIPVPAVVQGDEEQVGAFKPIHARAWFAAGDLAADDGFTELGAKELQDGGLQQECADGRGLMRQDFVHQVVGDARAGVGQVRQNPIGVLRRAPREDGQVQAGDPALGALLSRSTARASSGAGKALPTYAAVSSGVNRKSRARISVICPRARRLASGKDGLLREISTRCRRCGQWRISSLRKSCTASPRMAW